MKPLILVDKITENFHHSRHEGAANLAHKEKPLKASEVQLGQPQKQQGLFQTNTLAYLLKRLMGHIHQLKALPHYNS